MRYMLHLAGAPEDTTVYINGWLVGAVTHDQALEVNVTDQVALEDNRIVLKVCRPYHATRNRYLH